MKNSIIEKCPVNLVKKLKGQLESFKHNWHKNEAIVTSNHVTLFMVVGEGKGVPQPLPIL